MAADADYAAELVEAARDARALTEGMTHTQGDWHPSAGRWSIAECLTHLAATTRVYLLPIDLAITRGRGQRQLASTTTRPGVLGRWLVASMEPPPRFTMPAPRAVVPRSGASLAEALAEFIRLQTELEMRVTAAAGLNLRRLHLRSPFLPLVRLSLATCFAFLAAHQRRHLWQARRIEQLPGFPTK
ncbi:MAG: hypothetical protein NVS4B3_06440 [Gemmatimonadaceae bacterium]